MSKEAGRAAREPKTPGDVKSTSGVTVTLRIGPKEFTTTFDTPTNDLGATQQEIAATLMRTTGRLIGQ